MAKKPAMDMSYMDAMKASGAMQKGKSDSDGSDGSPSPMKKKAPMPFMKKPLPPMAKKAMKKAC